jgi:ABC-type Zn uptake system ZnuABC Zn-binding protein ZnuA
VDTSSGISILNNNPHIWLSPNNAIQQVKNILKALIQIDPDNAQQYTTNASQYIKKLQILDQDIKREVNRWRYKEIVESHPAFIYFAKDYGLTISAVILETPEKEPTASHLAEVIDTIRKKHIKAIFIEHNTNTKILKTITKDLNLKEYTLDTLENGEPYPDFYEDKMRMNLAVFKNALQ